MPVEPQLNSPEHDDVVMTLVELALSRPPEERERYLESACSDDTRLLSEAWNYVQREQRMRDFLLNPLVPRVLDEQPVKPGDLLLDRFRIVREVARGGMGVVYDAWDDRLERRIAIKCAKVGFRKRLPPEVRNASEISHPNVCKIFEIHTAALDGDEIDFLTMEFLEGETLAERMQRGPVERKEAKLIARQLCEGLAEAHRKQVIHGDLKSNNVILAAGAGGATRAVITDFGLARRPAAAQFDVQSGQIAGTPDYMAPELLKGEKASVASDIYALGAMLHELATGRHPIPPVMTFEDRLQFKPPPVRHPWNGILQRCLDPDPDRRYRSADEVAQALAPPLTRRWTLAATAAAVLAITSTVLITQRVPSPPETVRLAILPFESTEGTAAVAESLVRDTASQLARLKGSARKGLTFIPLSNHVDTPEKARSQLRATHALHGVLSEENKSLLLHAYVTDTHLLARVKEWKAEYAPGEERYAPVALTGVVTGALGLPPLQTDVTVNAAARSDYEAGLRYLRRNSTISTALPLLERAVAADRDSPLTHAALAEVRWRKYFDTGDTTWRAKAAESLREAERRNPDLAEVYRIAGLLKSDAGWYDQAAAAYLRAIELDPGNGDAHRRLGMAYDSNNQGDQAQAAFLSAVELESDYYMNHQALGNFLLNRADYSGAFKHLSKAVELAPEEPAACFALARACLHLGNYADAEKLLRKSLALGETSAALNTLGAVLMYQDRAPEAIPYFVRVLSRFPERYLWWMNLGEAYRRVNRKTEAQRANRRGLELAEAEMRKNPRSGYVRSCLAYLCAWLGDRRRAESEIAQALQLSPNDSDARRMAVKTYEALGRRAESLAVLRTSPPEVLADVGRYPDLADLRSDSRFQMLLGSIAANKY